MAIFLRRNNKQRIKSMDCNELILVEEYFYSNTHDFNIDAN